MTQLLVSVPDDRSEEGPALSCLADRERTFIHAMIQTGAGPEQVARAAAAAGYAANYGWALMRKPKILAALREEAQKRLFAGALVGATVLMDLAQDQKTKPELKFKVAQALLAHNGFMPVTEQRITVEHTGGEARQLIAEVKEFARNLGLDPQKLLGQMGVVDAEFEVVKVAEPKPAAAILATAEDEEVWSA